MPKENILIVDDDPAVRKSLTKTLRRAGYGVLEAGNPGDALEILESMRVDLAILDVQMPYWLGGVSEVAGIELLKQIKQLYPGMRVMMLTGVEDVETAVEAMNLGACDYVVKTKIAPKALLAKVRKALGPGPCEPAIPGPEYNIPAVRVLLLDALSPAELDRFCRDHPDFRPVLDLFGPDAGLGVRVDKMLAYCERRVLIDELLSEIEEENPKQFERHRGNLYV